MLASGFVLTPYSNGPHPRNGPAYVLYVGPITCIRPTDGVPARQLLSHMLTIVGFPADSWRILVNTAASHNCGIPSAAKAVEAAPLHRPTLARPPPCVPANIGNPTGRIPPAVMRASPVTYG